MAKHLRRKKHKRFPLVLLTVLIIIAVIFFDSNVRLVTDRFELGSSRLPASFEGFRIVQLSDLHCAEFGDGNKELFDAVRDENPNIIAITGDIITDEYAGDYVREICTELVKIAPVYYVTGNHEWACGWIKDLFGIMEECGVTVLRNKYEIISRNGEEIVIAGIDDPNGPYDQKTPEKLVNEIRAEAENRYILMLAHRNDEIDMWSELGVDAVLCGHAHGGVIRLPFTDGLIAPGMEWFPDYTSGVYLKGNTQMLVSRGIGRARGVPRFLNNPEVVSVTLTTAPG